MIGRVALVALAGCAVARADASAPGAAADRIACTVGLGGQFSARGRFDVNRINAPAVGGPEEPPPLAVSPAQLARLDRELPSAVDAVLAELGWTRIARAPRDLAPLVRELRGDRYFALFVDASPDNRVGGHFGGLDVGVRLRSLHRKEDLFNFQWATVKLGSDGELAGNLRAALRGPIAASLRDLRELIARPLTQLDLVLTAPGVDDAVLERAATCAANLATPVAEERLPGPGVRRRISVRVGRWKPDTSLEQWMSNYASRLPEIMRTPINLGCVMNTALEDRKLTVTRAGRTFTVSFGAR